MVNVQLIPLKYFLVNIYLYGFLKKNNMKAFNDYKVRSVRAAHHYNAINPQIFF